MNFVVIAEEAIYGHGAMQKRNELAGLLAIVHGLQPRVVFEIGTATGGTLWALSRVASPGVWVSIDIPGGRFSGGATVTPEDLNALVGADVVALRGDSREVEIPVERPDLLLIDGDHTYDGVKADWERWGPLVNPGGIVALHDIVPHPAGTAVEVSYLWSQISFTSAATVALIDRTDLGAAGHQWGGWGVVFR